jgi:hypothetical protein
MSQLYWEWVTSVGWKFLAAAAVVDASVAIFALIYWGRHRD